MRWPVRWKWRVLGNKYLTDTEPWKLEKTDPERTRTMLFNSLRMRGGIERRAGTLPAVHRREVARHAGHRTR